MRRHTEDEEGERQWRVDPIGYDAYGNAYWLFDDNRLYKEVRYRASKRSRRDNHRSNRKRTAGGAYGGTTRATTPGDEDEDDLGRDDEREFPERQKIDAGKVLGGKQDEEGCWKLVCRTREDWFEFPKQFEQSRWRDDRAFHEHLVESVLPPVLEALEAKKKSRPNDPPSSVTIPSELYLAAARRSTRVQARDIQRAEVERVSVQDVKRARYERLALARDASASAGGSADERSSVPPGDTGDDEPRRKLVESREQRVLEREQKRAEEQIRVERVEKIMEEQGISWEDAEKIVGKAAVESDSYAEHAVGTHRVGNINNEQKKRRRGRPPKVERDAEAEEEDWFFRCDGCGLAGKNLSDGVMVQCDGCEVWQHVSCNGLAGRDLRKMGRWECSQCKVASKAAGGLKAKGGYGIPDRATEKPVRSTRRSAAAAAAAAIVVIDKLEQEDEVSDFDKMEINHDTGFLHGKGAKTVEDNTVVEDTVDGIPADDEESEKDQSDDYNPNRRQKKKAKVLGKGRRSLSNTQSLPRKAKFDELRPEPPPFLKEVTSPLQSDFGVTVNSSRPVSGSGGLGSSIAPSISGQTTFPGIPSTHRPVIQAGVPFIPTFTQADSRIVNQFANPFPGQSIITGRTSVLPGWNPQVSGRNPTQWHLTSSHAHPPNSQNPIPLHQSSLSFPSIPMLGSTSAATVGSSAPATGISSTSLANPQSLLMASIPSNGQGPWPAGLQGNLLRAGSIRPITVVNVSAAANSFLPVAGFDPSGSSQQQVWKSHTVAGNPQGNGHNQASVPLPQSQALSSNTLAFSVPTLTHTLNAFSPSSSSGQLAMNGQTQQQYTQSFTQTGIDSNLISTTLGTGVFKSNGSTQAISASGGATMYAMLSSPLQQGSLPVGYMHPGQRLLSPQMSASSTSVPFSTP
ncbi:hypothetical protein HDU93_007886 [Gonapodya sp. JEL0774]|nr:hypothetical protein HDU93_007886 [Gonapodya sp. JEL0774]